MLTSDNKEESELAEDIIKYNMVTGGVQNAINIIKFIPSSYIKTKGFGRILREDVNSLKRMSNDSEHFIKEFYQHNPEKALKIDENFEQAKSKGELNGETISFVLENPGINVNEELSIAIKEEGKINIGYPNFISRRNIEKNIWELFEQTSKDSKGVTFVKIDTKGEFGLLEYNSSQKNTGTIIKSKMSKVRTQPKKKILHNTPISPTVENNEVEVDIVNRYEIKNPNLSGKQKFSAALKEISESSTITIQKDIG